MQKRGRRSKLGRAQGNRRLPVVLGDGDILELVVQPVFDVLRFGLHPVRLGTLFVGSLKEQQLGGSRYGKQFVLVLSQVELRNVEVLLHCIVVFVHELVQGFFDKGRYLGVFRIQEQHQSRLLLLLKYLFLEVFAHNFPYFLICVIGNGLALILSFNLLHSDPAEEFNKQVRPHFLACENEFPQLKARVLSFGHNNLVSFIRFEQLVGEIVSQELGAGLCKQHSFIAEHLPPVDLSGPPESLPHFLQLFAMLAVCPVDQQHLELHTTAKNSEVVVVIENAHVANGLHIEEVQQIVDLGLGGAVGEVQEGLDG